MGKWTQVMKDHKLKARLEMDPNDHLFQTYSGKPTRELLHDYAVRRKERDDFKIKDKLRGQHLAAIQAVLSTRMSEQGISSVKLEDPPVTVMHREEPYIVVVSMNDFNEFAASVPDLAGSFRVPWQTYNSFGKEVFLKTGKAMPGTELRARHILSMRKS